jgi:pimeloyl-ACP methyl ester carboxylesterase
MKLRTVRFEENLGKEEIQNIRKIVAPVKFLETKEDEISENTAFDYYIAEPENPDYSPSGKSQSAILLFHGLNERNWDKYISWVEYLADKSGRVVIMFPLSMHMNRSPKEWANPRAMQRLISMEFSDKKDFSNLSFLNYALSSRIKSDPFRFYLSGRESILNVCQLMDEIRTDRHPVVHKDAKIDIFAYSIGGLLAQVLLKANPYDFFSKSKLFMFCAGSLFNEMNGDSKMIMDRDSFASLKKYYIGDFIRLGAEKRRLWDYIETAFTTHIGEKFFRGERENFYKNNSHRVSVISLKRDIVIPTSGIRLALGSSSDICLEEMDFPFDYSHENPFPVSDKINPSDRKYYFDKIFSRAVEFLS